MTNEEKILDILASMSLRMGNIEKRIGADDGRFDSIDNRLTKMGFQIETEMIPRLDALAEGQAALLEQLAPSADVDALQDRVQVLEAVTGSLAEDLEALRKAQ